jgi:hypothetical protein
MDPGFFLRKRYAEECTKNDPAGGGLSLKGYLHLARETLRVIVATARLQKHSQVQKNQLISQFH